MAYVPLKKSPGAQIGKGLKFNVGESGGVEEGSTLVAGGQIVKLESCLAIKLPFQETEEQRPRIVS